MSAVSIYRALLVMRVGWLILGWFFPWGTSARMHEISLTHPYLVLFAQAIGIALWLVVFAGLWFFRRWARLVFVAVLGFALVYSVFRPYHPAAVAPRVVVRIDWFMLMVNGAIVAMSFLPSVRDMFEIKPNQSMQPIAD